jgi:hypothetical protein
MVFGGCNYPASTTKSSALCALAYHEPGPCNRLSSAAGCALPLAPSASRHVPCALLCCNSRTCCRLLSPFNTRTGGLPSRKTSGVVVLHFAPPSRHTRLRLFAHLLPAAAYRLSHAKHKRNRGDCDAQPRRYWRLQRRHRHPFP